MAFVPTGSVACQDVVAAIIVEVDSIITVQVRGVVCKCIAARIVKVAVRVLSLQL
jgi:hypothetical protein